MAQPETCFAGSVLQGFCILDWIAIRELCVLFESTLNLPHACGATLRRWPLGIAHASSLAIGPQKPSLAIFGAIALEHSLPGKNSQIWAHFEETFFRWTQPGKIWLILHGLWVGEFCGNSAAVLEFSQKTLCVNFFVFLAAALRKYSLKAACLQNETGPEKLLNRYEKRFEKREKKIRKTIRNVFEKVLAPLRPLKNISPARFN